MFTEEQMGHIDPEYFEVMAEDHRNIMLKSRNTGHTWYLFHTGRTGHGAVWIFHRHHDEDMFHRHGCNYTLPLAIRDIQLHDEFQLNGRIPVRNSVWDGVPI